MNLQETSYGIHNENKSILAIPSQKIPVYIMQAPQTMRQALR